MRVNAINTFQSQLPRRNHLKAETIAPVVRNYQVVDFQSFADTLAIKKMRRDSNKVDLFRFRSKAIITCELILIRVGVERHCRRQAVVPQKCVKEIPLPETWPAAEWPHYLRVVGVEGRAKLAVCINT